MDDVEIKRAKLHLFKFEKHKSSEQILEGLTAALKYARENEVCHISIEMQTPNGGLFSADLGEFPPPKSQG